MFPVEADLGRGHRRRCRRTMGWIGFSLILFLVAYWATDLLSRLGDW
ncbi:MAG: hypothetical protein ABI083_02420 [Lapillicoccus sp.]